MIRLNRYNQLVRDAKVIRGQWALSPGHVLSYKFEDGAPEKELGLAFSLLAVEAGTLVAAVHYKEGDKSVSQILRLAGKWNVDTRNRITFEVARENSAREKLVFKGSWEVDQNQHIVYRYERQNLKTKSRQSHALAIDGFWEISDKNRLTYLIEGDDTQALVFRCAFQTQSILAKKNEIRYRLGVEVQGKRRVQKVSLFGQWKLSRDLGLSFEIPYENDTIKSIVFGGQYALSKDTSIAIDLKSQKGLPLGVELVLTKDIFKGDGQIFARLQKNLEESRIEAGARIQW